MDQKIDPKKKEEGQGDAKPLFKKKKNLKNGKNMRRKRPKSDSDQSGDDTKVAKVQITQKRINAFSTTSGSKEGMQQAGVYESTREVVPTKYAGDATYTTEIDTATDRDARAIAERNLKLNAEGATNDETKIYRGQAGYKNYIEKKESQIGGNKYTGTQGPIRAPSNIRAICRFDYQPDICKDYKETGFCGYGDSCKFIHDRGDYKSGWQLEQEWEEQQKKKKEKEMLGEWASDAEEGDGDNPYLIDSDDELPFACHICREDFEQPVATLCGHYFCEECALEHYKTDKRCAICGKQTSGIFNQAKKIVERMKLRDGSAATDTHNEEGGGEPSTATTTRKKKKSAWTVVEDGPLLLPKSTSSTS